MSAIFENSDFSFTLISERNLGTLKKEAILKSQ
jgi:hypothetical protein